MFGWSENKENEKYGEEKMVENDIFYCLVKREKGREKWWGPQVFSPPSSKYNLSKLERKVEKNI